MMPRADGRKEHLRAHPGHHHGSRRSRLPQLQHRLPRRRLAAEVVAFTATQIPNIEGRRYPPELAGPLYPEGIPIHPEADLPRLIRELKVDQVVFAYSDVSHETVMHKASLVLAAAPTSG